MEFNSAFEELTVVTVKMLLMISENVALNMRSSQGTINYSTQLHLFGDFVKIVS
jgi:hypothetical protein